MAVIANDPQTTQGDRAVTDNNPHIGSSFESFLQEKGIAAAVNSAAVKHVLA